MAASGNAITLTFTPAVSCNVKVISSFEAQFSGSDWGTGSSGYLFLSQGGVTTFGDVQRFSSARQKYPLQYVFSVAAGVSVTCGLYAAVTGAASLVLQNIEFEVDLAKR